MEFEAIPFVLCSTFIISVTLRMAAMRNFGAAFIGIAGFIGGTYYENFKLYKHFEVSASTYLITNISDADTEPMVGDPPQNITAKIMRFGFPGFDNIQTRKSYVVSYDRRNRVPNWVCEYLTKDSVKLAPNVNRSKSEFIEDTSIHPYFRSRNNDYRNSGFDKGHLAAAGNHRSSQAHVDDTFVLSNIAPQVGKGFNRDTWNRLENYVRNLTMKYVNVYVCSGPLYLPKLEADGKKYVKYQVIGDSNVAVPTHFFKVIVGEAKNRQVDLESYVMPNAVIDDRVPLANFTTPKDGIERSAGLLLFDKIPLKNFRTINGAKG